MRLSEILFENGSIPKPSRDDLYDAIEMAQESYPEEYANWRGIPLHVWKLHLKPL